MQENIAVVGAGAWGRALYGAIKSAQIATNAAEHQSTATAGNRSTAKSKSAANRSTTAEDHKTTEAAKNPTPGSANGPSILISSRTPRQVDGFVPLNRAFEADFIVLAVASQQVAPFLKSVQNDLKIGLKNKKFLIAAKGIETATGRFLDEVMGEFAPRENLAFLSGPSFAAEVAKNLPCALVISSTNSDLAAKFAAFFPPFIKTYTGADVAGAEVCGAYKNVIAIASGVCAGLGLGQNARASLISRGLVEMARFGAVFGARSDTFLGLSGAGDLFLTASSELSRNYRTGLGLAQKTPLKQILADLGEVAEGVSTAYAITKIARARGIYTPIAAEVVALLEGKDPSDSLKTLLRKNN